MMKITTSPWGAWCAALLFLVLPTVCTAADTIRINGSGNALDMMRPMVAAYEKTNRDARITMEKPLGSSGAIKALLAGALDLAVTSRTIKAEEAAKGARARTYGTTPLVIVTGNNVGLTDISTKQLEDVYAGRVRKWPNGEQIRLVLRPREDMDTRVLSRLSPGMDRAISASHARPGMIVAITDPESYLTIAKTPGGIGTASLNSILTQKPRVTVLSLNGVKPSPTALASGTYPLVKEIHFIVTAATPPSAQRLIDFIFSPRGRAIAQKNGVLVLPRPAPAK